MTAVRECSFCLHKFEITRLKRKTKYCSRECFQKYMQQRKVVKKSKEGELSVHTPHDKNDEQSFMTIMAVCGIIFVLVVMYIVYK